MDETICVFGASSTWGAWDLEKGGWVNRLRIWVDEMNLDEGDRAEFYVQVYNQGVSGDKTGDLLRRFDIEAAAREPTMLIFSIGDNDSAGGKTPDDHRVPLDEFRHNIEQIIIKAKAYTDKIVFLGLKYVDETKTNPVEWNSEARYTIAGIQKYDQALREILKKHNVEYLSSEGLLKNDDLSDGLHPNESGHEKLFQQVKSFLQENKWL